MACIYCDIYLHPTTLGQPACFLIYFATDSYASFAQWLFVTSRRHVLLILNYFEITAVGPVKFLWIWHILKILQSVMSCGRLFQSVGPAAANAWSPMSDDEWAARRATAKTRTTDVAATGYPPSDKDCRISMVGRDHAVTETPSSLACTGCAQKNTTSED